MPTEYPTLMNCPWRRASVSGHYVRVKRIVMWGYTRQRLLPPVNPERIDIHNLHENYCPHLCTL